MNLSEVNWGENSPTPRTRIFKFRMGKKRSFFFQNYFLTRKKNFYTSTKYTKRSRIATFGGVVFKILVILAIFLDFISSRYQGSGIRDQGTGNEVQGSGNRDQGTGIRDQAIGNCEL